MNYGDRVNGNAVKNKKKLLIALENNLGIVTAACKEVGLSRETFYGYKRNDDEFRKKVEDLDNFVMDFVEHQLYKKIKDGSETSILFYMRYKGKKRGYTQASDINITTNNEIPLFGPLNNDDQHDNTENIGDAENIVNKNNKDIDE